MVSAQFLRKVSIKRYQHLSTTTHTFVVIYSLSWMHCTKNDIKYMLTNRVVYLGDEINFLCAEFSDSIGIINQQY